MIAGEENGDEDDAITQFFRDNPLGFGTGDILFLGRSGTSGQIVDIFKRLICYADEEGKSPIHRFVLVTPPTADSEETQKLEKRLQLALKASNLAPLGVPANEWLQLVRLGDLRIQSVVEVLKGLPDRTVVIVNSAALFRDDDVRPHVTDAPNRLTLSEDYWAPNLHFLAQQLRKAVEGRPIYFILNARELSPRREALRELVQSVNGVGVLGSSNDGDLETVLALNEQALGSGQPGEALKAIDELPAAFDREKPFLRIQTMYSAGLIGQALEQIEALLDRLPDNLSPYALAKLARIAQEGGASALSVRLLGASLDGLDSRESLELALDTAGNLDDSNLSEQIAKKLDAIYPTSAILNSYKFRTAVAAGQHAIAADLLSKNAEQADTAALYKLLGIRLAGAAVPDYPSILAEIRRKVPDKIGVGHRQLIRDAMRRGLPMHALDIALQPPAAPEHFDIQLLLEVFEQLILQRTEQGDFAIDRERLKAALEMAIKYLAAHPDDGQVRINLARLLSVSGTGNLGLALIASTTLDFLRAPLALRKNPKIDGFSAEEFHARMDFVRKAYKWIASHQPFVFGRVVLPKDLLSEPADKFLPTIENLIRHGEEDLSTADGEKALFNILALGTSLAPHTSNPNIDLEFIRLAGARLIVAGRIQTARDLAELVSQTSAGNSERQRIAWSAFADIYHRFGNSVESLLALAAAAAGDPKMTEQQAWQELDTLVRLLRDVGLFDAARQALGKLKAVLQRMGLAELNRNRLALTALQIDVREYQSTASTSRERLADLINTATEITKEALAKRDAVTPVAMMLGQLVRTAEDGGSEIPEEARNILKTALKELDGPAALLVSAITGSDLKPQQVLDLHLATQRARYSEDAGYDARSAVIAAQRLLDPRQKADAEAVAFAVELLSDRAIAMPGWEVTATPPPPLSSLSEPASMAVKLSREGLVVVMAAVDIHGRLSRVVAQDGKLGPVVREDEKTFSGDKFLEWSKDHPYRYGIEEDKNNSFMLSMDGIGLSLTHTQRTVLVMDTHLQQIPANLLKFGDEFAGRHTPIATAPSLAWLSAARTAKVAYTGKKIAWISTSDSEGQTLAMIAERMSETLTKHKIELHTEGSLPNGLTGADLLVIAAHGGLLPNEQYFQKVSDEGNSQFGVSDFATTIRNVGVVILFVCSGGRTDKHPTASTVVGLAKEILDSGCTAVIASPWPLNSSVPPHWLPAFLDAWKGDVTLVEAVAAANQAVAKALGDNVGNSLAMNVYGDPLRLSSR